MRFLPRSRVKRWLLLGLAVAGLASCSTVRFYSQAALGQWEIIHKARPIPTVLSDAATKPKLRTKLDLVQRVRTFAKDELHLPVKGQFGDYADLGRPYVVWVVFAAPEFSVEAKTWWYPLVGSLKYRGFFDEVSAKAEAAKLKQQGYDVYVGGTEAYSTLGWFDDPVLNTFLGRDDADLAELIIHELTHARIFLPGDTDFNEALATTVAEAGVKRWLRKEGRLDELKRYEAAMAKDREIIALLLKTRAELETAYQSTTDNTKLHALKEKAFATMQQRYQAIRAKWSGDSRYDKFFAKPMNNARLNTMATYYDLLPGFERMLAACDGDLERFFAQLETLRPLTDKERRARVLGPQAGPAS